MKEWHVGDWIVVGAVCLVAFFGLRGCMDSSGGTGGGGGYDQYDQGPDCFAGPRGMECE
jgi:hypothetical protein